jgi:hypothetical protein
LAVVGVVSFGVGMWIRAAETTRCVDPVHNAKVLAAYREELPPSRTSQFAANSVVGGVFDFVSAAAVLDNLRPLCDELSAYSSPSVSDAELHERLALNDLLLGVDRAAFETRHRALLEGPSRLGFWKHDGSHIPDRVAARLAAYDRACADLPAALDRFAIRYVALPAGHRPDYLARGWTALVTGPTWDIWERTTTLTMRPGQ